MALVAMAFLAVLREGFETSVFLLAAFNDATDPRPPASASSRPRRRRRARLRDLPRRRAPRTSRASSASPASVLVLVAAGLVASSLHTAAEAGWVVGGQQQALDLSAIIRPGTVWASLHHRHPRHPAAADGDRGHRLAALRDPDARVRPSRPTACARSVRASVAGVAVVGGAGRAARRRRSAAAATRAAVASAARRGRTVNVAITDAGCEPGGAEARAPARRPSSSPTRARERDRVRGRSRAAGRWRRPRTSPTG